MPRLTPSQITSALEDLSLWDHTGDSLTREITFSDFPAAIAFVDRIAQIAEAANHHPDIDIRYNRVRLSLTSHDSGGITERDIRLAKAISAL